MRKLPLKSWLALLGMTVSAFIFNTSEFMPIGLLTDIAESFAISEAKVGMMISAYAWAVMILSLPLMILASRVDYRRLLLGTVTLFAVSQALFRLCGKLLYAHGGALGRGLCSCGILVDSFAVSSALGK